MYITFTFNVCFVFRYDIFSFILPQSDSNKHLNVIPQKLTFLKSSYGGLMHFFRQALQLVCDMA